MPPVRCQTQQSLNGVRPAATWGNIVTVSADLGPGSNGHDGSASGLAGFGAHESDPPQSAGRVAAIAFAALLYFPIKSLLDSHPSATKLGLTLAGVAASFVVYMWRLVFAPMASRPSPGTWISLAVTTALVVALVVGDDPKRWAPLFIFLSAVIGVRVALPWAAYCIAACTVVSAVALLPAAPIDKTLTIAIETLALGALTTGMGRLRATINQLQEARQQLARMAVTEERLRFARDLHDLLGHSLSVIALKADLAGRLLPGQPDRAAKEAAEIDGVARRALSEVRDAVSGYRQPTVLEAIATGRLALDAAGIDTSCDIAQVALPPALDAVLAWALREAITNVIRHSRARHCWISVSAGLVEAAAEVVDDGVGGPGEPGSAPVSAPTEGGALPGWAGSGLVGLAEHVGALQGRLEVAARPEGGFRLKASIPTPASLIGQAP